MQECKLQREIKNDALSSSMMMEEGENGKQHFFKLKA